jgi:hypothetical protein
MQATDNDIARALDLRNPHVNTIVSELHQLRKQIESIQMNAGGPLYGLGLRRIDEIATGG